MSRKPWLLKSYRHDVGSMRRWRPTGIFSRWLRLALSVLAILAAFLLLFLALRPSPDATIDGHWRQFARAAVPALIVLAVTVVIAPRGLRILVLAVALVSSCGAALLHPVCDPIHDDEVPAFESVQSLEERAAHGEPFCELDGHWYQCKSFLARSFFF